MGGITQNTLLDTYGHDARDNGNDIDKYNDNIDDNATSVAAVEELLRKVFLRGGGAVLAADGVFSSAETAEAWVRQSAAQFPGGAALEARLERILTDLTEHLPTDHPLRVRPSGLCD